jgi:uncharacterized membrane protein YedE/YeeE
VSLHASFTPAASLLGGVLIGLSASLLWATHGRIAGITGILGESLRQRGQDLEWRLLFLAGLVGGGRLIGWVWPAAFGARLLRPGAVALLVAGVLVGFGTRLGNGCTSGHGVCGIGRLSPRSIVATLVFVAAGMVTVWTRRHLLGGGS